MSTDFENAIQAAFSAREPREIYVEEWDRTIYVFPLTMLQLEEIDKAPNNYRVAVETIRVRAKNADGSPAFKRGELEKLYSHGVDKYGPGTILAVSRAINAGEEEPTTGEDADALVEDLEGN